MPTEKYQLPIFKYLGAFFLISIFISCSMIGDRKGKDLIPVTVDLSASSHQFKGMGANVPISFYNRRTKPLQALNDLSIKYIRVKRQSDNWNDILAMRSATQRLRIKWVYTLDEIPVAYLDESGRLKDIQGFAVWWAEEVAELEYQEVPADYIEIVNRPDGVDGSSGVMDSDTFNTLIHELRKQLEIRELDLVQLLGPGLSNPSVAGERETWFMDLDQAAFEALAAWSLHAYRDTSYDMDLGRGIEELQSYLDRIESLKPIFVDAYASRMTSFAGLNYPDPEHYDIHGNLPDYESYYYSATFSVPYGLRVFENTLSLLATPNVVPFIDQLFDAPDDVKYEKRSWGLIDLNGHQKPVFEYLAALLNEVPDQAGVHKVDLMHDQDLRGLAFSDRSELVFTLANRSSETKGVRVVLKNGQQNYSYEMADMISVEELNPPHLGRMDKVVHQDMELKLRKDSAGNQYFQLTMSPHSVFVTTLISGS